MQGGAIVLLVLLAFFPALRGGFIWDDDAYVTGNQALHDWNGLRRIWFVTAATPQYYPLVHTTFWLEYHLWGLNPFGFHLVNVLLHALAAILLWRVLLRLQLPGAWLAAAIFALHPVQVETVAWITERKNVLSAVFYFAAALTYLGFVTSADAGVQNKRRSCFYLGALVLFVAALLSKTVTCSLPAALLLVCWWKRGRLRRADILSLAPFFLIGLRLGLMTAWLEKYHVGAQGAEWSLSFIQRCLIAGRALWFYAGKLFWPARLVFIYPRWAVSASVWWQWLFPAAALGVVAVLWRARQRIGRGPLVAVLFFAGTLGPALGFVNVYPMRFSFVADHFQYLAGVGLIALATAGMSVGIGLLGQRRVFLEPAVCATLLAVLGVLTWRQTRMYADIETLWQTTILRNPDCSMARNNLGSAFVQQGRMDEAIAQFQNALAIKPDYAEAHNNLGIALVHKGQADNAIAQYQMALETKPDYAEARNNLGNALVQQGRMDEAIAQYQKALATKPGDAEAHNNLGNVFVQQGRMEEGIAQYQKALATRPDYANAHYNLGNAFLQQGRMEEGIAQFQEALAVNPNDADTHFNLGCIFLQQGHTGEAIAQFEKTLAIRPDDADAQNSLALVLATCPQATLRNGSKAVGLAERVEQLDGGKSPVILATLAAAYAEAGRFPEAVTTRV
jgi:tetratricopeptide (TPR) repeat protein